VRACHLSMCAGERVLGAAGRPHKNISFQCRVAQAYAYKKKIARRPHCSGQLDARGEKNGSARSRVNFHARVLGAVVRWVDTEGWSELGGRNTLANQGPGDRLLSWLCKGLIEAGCFTADVDDTTPFRHVRNMTTPKAPTSLGSNVRCRH